MGVQANKKRVYSIYFYYTDRKKYNNIFSPSLLFLRVKLKINDEFKNRLETKKEEMDEKHKLILDVCNLPDTQFFPIITYLINDND